MTNTIKVQIRDAIQKFQRLTFPERLKAHTTHMITFTNGIARTNSVSIQSLSANGLVCSCSLSIG